ncbi:MULTISPECIES: TIGR03752 family integrating conjugative element protein [Pseudomonas]|uniref:TIGR03752 family integrating conjugative element protein n=1 Tax=Pseudomonas TaxID=286 RepID=UPI0003DBE89B|nr:MULTISPECIES: TIGR03752 family integrating conjugative element protein [Pseudomonas]ETK22731.1 integrating conjugative element protein [Pseudomonas sp. FH1]MDB1111896.1 TIGR03752 family integrating conjugative element protein [Pseudomonas extremaustralis]
MGSLKSNPLLKYLLIPVLIVALIILFRGGSKKEAATPEDETITIGSDTARKLGVDGDTPADTLRTVVAESREVKDQITKVLTDNKELKDQNAELQRRISRIDQNVDNKLNDAKGELQEQVKNQSMGLLDQFQHQLDNLSQNPNAAGQDLPIGLGVQPGDGASFDPNKPKGLVWVEPTDATPLDASGKPLQPGSALAASGFNFPTSFGNTLDKGQTVLSTTAQNVGAEMSPQDARKQVRKAYTLPQNSTLMGSVAMSALIGRVPIDGTVNDPFPFKVLIGPDNLTANGIELPDVVGAIASGTASGDWTLSCVRGQVRSLTFVFADGTVRSFPAPAEEANGSQNNNQNSSNGNGQPAIQGGLGWISDSYGIPCISGDRRSNAKEYLTNQSLVTAAGAGIAKLLKADEQNSTTSFSSGGTSFGTTGSSGNSAMGAILTGGVSDIRSWMNKLYGEAFAAVYVQPGAKVAVHLDQQLSIDYEIKGRKVDYNAGANHVSANLD